MSWAMIAVNILDNNCLTIGDNFEIQRISDAMLWNQSRKSQSTANLTFVSESGLVFPGHSSVRVIQFETLNLNQYINDLFKFLVRITTVSIETHVESKWQTMADIAEHVSQEMARHGTLGTLGTLGTHRIHDSMASHSLILIINWRLNNELLVQQMIRLYSDGLTLHRLTRHSSSTLSASAMDTSYG